MRARPLPFLLLTALAASSFGPSAFGQRKTGTTIGLFTLIEPSARVAAMGNAGVAAPGEVTAVFFNPAAAALLAGSDAQFTHSEWLAGITYDFAAVGLRLGAANTVYFSVTALNSGDIDVRTVEQPEGTGERYTVNDVAIAAGYSRQLTDRFSAGGQATYVRETIWHSTLQAVGINVGVAYRLPFGPYLGASLSNFGSRGKYDGRDLRIQFDQDRETNGDNSALPAALTTEEYPLPIQFRVGLGWPVEVSANQRLNLLAEAVQPSDNAQSLSLGGEYSFNNLIALRAGYQGLFQPDAMTGPSLGAGVNARFSGVGLRFDYAWSSYGDLDSVQRFTVGVGF